MPFNTKKTKNSYNSFSHLCPSIQRKQKIHTTVFHTYVLQYKENKKFIPQFITLMSFNTKKTKNSYHSLSHLCPSIQRKQRIHRYHNFPHLIKFFNTKKTENSQIPQFYTLMPFNTKKTNNSYHSFSHLCPSIQRKQRIHTTVFHTYVLQYKENK